MQLSNKKLITINDTKALGVSSGGMGVSSGGYASTKVENSDDK